MKVKMMPWLRDYKSPSSFIDDARHVWIDGVEIDCHNRICGQLLKTSSLSSTLVPLKSIVTQTKHYFLTFPSFDFRNIKNRHGRVICLDINLALDEIRLNSDSADLLRNILGHELHSTRNPVYTLQHAGLSIHFSALTLAHITLLSSWPVTEMALSDFGLEQTFHAKRNDEETMMLKSMSQKKKPLLSPRDIETLCFFLQAERQTMVQQFRKSCVSNSEIKPPLFASDIPLRIKGIQHENELLVQIARPVSTAYLPLDCSRIIASWPCVQIKNRVNKVHSDERVLVEERWPTLPSFKRKKWFDRTYISHYPEVKSLFPFSDPYPYITREEFRRLRIKQSKPNEALRALFKF